MGTAENLCLRWNDHETNASTSFRDLREESDLFDVTLACADESGCWKTLQAHRLVLSASSAFFKQMLRQPGNNNKTAYAGQAMAPPLIYLRGVRFADLESLLDYIYNGEVNLGHSDLPSFMAVAEELQVKGLIHGRSAGAAKQATKRSGGRRTSSSQAESKRTKKDGIKEFAEIKGEAITLDSSSAIQSVEEFEVNEHGSQDSSSFGADAHYQTYDYEEAETIDDGMSNMDGQEPEKVTDLNVLIQGLVTFKEGIHTCNLCGKKSPWRTTMVRHVESNHVETAGHVCDICGKVSKTTHAFQMHKKRVHMIPGPSSEAAESSSATDLLEAGEEHALPEHGDAEEAARAAKQQRSRKPKQLLDL